MHKSLTHISLLFFLFLYPLTSAASVGKVIKVQGNRAIVEFPKGTKLNPGTPLSTGETSSDESTTETSAGGHDGQAKRDYGVSYSFGMSSVTIGSSTTSSTQLSSMFFLNYGHFEIAPILTYSSPSANSSAVGVGLLGKYNFISNKHGNAFIPGLYLKAISNSITQSSSSSSITYAGGGASLDWFPFGDHAAFTLGVDYYTYTTTANANVSTTTLSSGLKVYW